MCATFKLHLKCYLHQIIIIIYCIFLVLLQNLILSCYSVYLDILKLTHNKTLNLIVTTHGWNNEISCMHTCMWITCQYTFLATVSLHRAICLSCCSNLFYNSWLDLDYFLNTIWSQNLYYTYFKTLQLISVVCMHT